MAAARVKAQAAAQPAQAGRSQGKQRVTIILHSGDLDKVTSAFIIANGNLAMGWEASIYVTFWGLLRLRKGQLAKGPLSRWNLLGLGSAGMRWRMRQRGVQPLEDLVRDFKALGGRLIACEMTMEVMGLRRDQLDEDLIDDYGAVGTWWQDAQRSGITLFL
jgi:peroxiredoxin family protein